MRRLLVLAIGLPAVIACVSAPPFPEPTRTIEQSSSWAQVTDANAVAQNPVDLAWWQQFDDPALNALVTTAWQNNYDIQMSQARLREAMAGRRQARALLLPSVGATASYTWTEQSVSSPAGPSSLIAAGFIDRDLEFWNAGLEHNWQVDLFGANRYQIRSAAARLKAAEAARYGAALAVLAEVVSAYVEYHGLERRTELVRRNVALQEKSLHIIENRARIGLETRLAVRRAAGQLNATRALLPALTSASRAVLYRMTVLLDIPVEEVETQLGVAKPAALPTENPGLGIKSQVLQRRPDVAVAEFMLQASAAEVGVARANLFPQLVIGARSGYESGTVATLLDAASRNLAVVPALSVPVFQGGRLRAQRDAALARWENALANYRKTVLGAFAQSEIRLAEYAAEQEAARDYFEAYQQEHAAAVLAQKLYDRGLLEFLQLIDAQRQVLVAEDAWIRNQIRQQFAWINLYVALGGGWQQFAAQETPGGG